MPVFHFDITIAFRLEDPVGTSCASESDARQTADRIARQIAMDIADDDRERCVLVIDEAGSEIYKAPVLQSTGQG